VALWGPPSKPLKLDVVQMVSTMGPHLTHAGGVRAPQGGGGRSVEQLPSTPWGVREGGGGPGALATNLPPVRSQHRGIVGAELPLPFDGQLLTCAGEMPRP